MLSKGRPKSIVPLDFTLANGLTVVPEVPTPTFDFQMSTNSFHEPTQTRPLSSYTEIESLSEQDFDEPEEIGRTIQESVFDEEENDEYIEHDHDEEYYYPRDDEEYDYEVEYETTYEQQVKIFEDIRRSRDMVSHEFRDKSINLTYR